jgi:hypothetical protein
MKVFTVFACLLSVSLPVLGSALSESEGMDSESEGVESYKIPVTIGVSGMMVTNQSKTSKVMLSHPNGKEITVVKISSQEQGKNQRYNVASLSSEDLGKPFYVYYPSEYIQNREMNRERALGAFYSTLLILNKLQASLYLGDQRS